MTILPKINVELVTAMRTCFFQVCPKHKCVFLQEACSYLGVAQNCLQTKLTELLRGTESRKSDAHASLRFYYLSLRLSAL